MPVRKRCLGVDLGSNVVKIAEIALDKGGIKVLNLAQKEVNIFPGTPDSEKQQILGKAVREILKEKKIATREAIFCVSGQSVFVRQIKLPRTTPDRLRKIIHYETKQQIPFPIEKTYIEYQIFDTGEKDAVNVLLVAIKREFIQDYMYLINKTGLKPVGISVSTFAIYNFYDFEAVKDKKKSSEEKGKSKIPKINLKKFLKRKGKASETVEEDLSEAAEEEIPFEEVKAYVNIGATTLDLTIARFGGTNILGFTRSVPYAGNEITRNIQEKCGIESFQEADQIKKDETVVLSFGIEDTLGEEVNIDASQAATHVVDRIIADIRRSLDFYMAQPDGMAVDCIYLSGGQVKLKNLDTYIEDKLGLRVEIKNSFNNPKLIFRETPSELSQYVISIGLALTGIGSGAIDIDFLPSEIKIFREFKKKNIFVVVDVALIILMVVISTNIGDNVKRRYNDDIIYYGKQIEKYKPDKDEADKAIAKRRTIDEGYKYMDWALGKRDFWFPIIVEIQGNKPSDMWIQELKMEGYGRVRITGYTERQESAAFFTRSLKEAFKDLPNKLIVASKEPELMNILKERPRPDLPEYFKFVIKLTVKGKKSRIQAETMDEDELKKAAAQGQRPMFAPGAGPQLPGVRMK